MLQAVQILWDTFHHSVESSNDEKASVEVASENLEQNVTRGGSHKFQVWELNQSNYEHWIIRADGMLWKYFSNTGEPPTLVGNVYIPGRALRYCTPLDPEHYSLRLRYWLQKIRND